jgi:hypothetical protein
MSSDVMHVILSTLIGFTSSSVFVLALFIGFCVLIGFTKTKRSAGGGMVVKSLEEAVNRRAVVYLAPTDPRGPADQLKAPELVEAAARRPVTVGNGL